MGFFLSEERRNYYKAKKLEISRKEQEREVVRNDALYIKYYGMSAYMELFPDAKDFGTKWHSEVIEELVKLDRKALANQLSGIAMAVSAGNSKKSARKFKRVIKDMLK